MGVIRARGEEKKSDAFRHAIVRSFHMATEKFCWLIRAASRMLSCGGIHGWDWRKQFRKLLYFPLPFHARCTTNTHRPDGSLLRSVKPSNFFVSFSVGFTNRLWFTRMKSRTLWAIAKSMHPKTERRKHLRQSNQLFLRFSFM